MSSKGSMRELQRIGSGDCLSKTQDSAKANSRCIGSDACPMLEGYGEGLVVVTQRSSELKPQ